MRANAPKNICGSEVQNNYKANAPNRLNSWMMPL